MLEKRKENVYIYLIMRTMDILRCILVLHWQSIISLYHEQEDSQFMRDVIKKYGRNPDTIMFTNDIKTVYKKPSDGFTYALKITGKS